jgi:UDP-N-acetylmuramoylalanine--D-glutamate ligase
MFAKSISNLTSTYLCQEFSGLEALRCAVDVAIKHLESNHAGQGSVLFAPLAASFDQYKDYKERAAVFRQVVHERGV